MWMNGTSSNQVISITRIMPTGSMNIGEAELSRSVICLILRCLLLVCAAFMTAEWKVYIPGSKPKTLYSRLSIPSVHNLKRFLESPQKRLRKCLHPIKKYSHCTKWDCLCLTMSHWCGLMITTVISAGTVTVLNKNGQAEQGCIII